MLYKNGKQYKITDAEKNVLKNKFHFPLKLVYPTHLIRPSAINRLPDQPASINIPCRSIIRTKDGETEEWRWAKSLSYDLNNRTKFTPRNLPFQGSAMLTEMDLELLYFLYHKSPHCENGLLPPELKKKIYFTIEDLVTIATQTVSIKALKARYEVMVNDKEIGLPEKKLREIAKAYFIPRVDELHIDQVRVAIDINVKRDPRNGMQAFIELSKSDQFLEIRGKIQTAIDLEIIYFYPRERKWRWKVMQGEKPENICKVLSKTTPENSLIEWYGADVDFQKRLDAELEDRGAMEPDRELQSEPGAGATK